MILWHSSSTSWMLELWVYTTMLRKKVEFVSELAQAILVVHLDFERKREQ